MHSVVHFEIPSDDIGRATKFYRELFGWRIEPTQGYENYNFVTIGDGVPGGAIMDRPPVYQGPLVYFGTENIADTIAKAERLGASVVQGRSPVPGMGWYAMLRDTEGNLIALWQRDERAK